MNPLKVIEVYQTEMWDAVVKSFSNFDVFYLNGYARTFQLNGDGEPLLFYYDDGDTRGINVVMKRDVHDFGMFGAALEKDCWFDLSTPYGYGGFWTEGENYDAINSAYDEYCREQGYICEFVRFHLLSSYHKHYNGICEPRTHNIVRTLDISAEEMLMDFEHKVRKNIKRARQNEIEIIIDEKCRRLEDFLGIYYRTMERREAERNYFFTRDFFETLSTMEDCCAYVYALYKGKAISAELVIFGTENCYSFMGGTDQEYFYLRPNDYLKFETMMWAREKGFKKYVLGGGYGSDDGIYNYKKSFAPNGICDFYVGKKIFDACRYEKLMNIRKSQFGRDMNTNYFPQYRG